jgi:hypothetical protein
MENTTFDFEDEWAELWFLSINSLFIVLLI